ncbi:MAG TPA: hypothetical protein VG325_16830 [Solirubrobacteraceae bacterium]|jgi:hypothetical protein|nr:hypothetical protein [Solirubrobacteraceae bacterium]
MSTSTAGAGGAVLVHPDAGVLRRLRLYFASDTRRAIQTALGLLWLLDGALQFQSFMYSKGFIDMLSQMMPGQPGWLGSSMRWASKLAATNLTLFNTLFALTQVVIGLALLYRPTVKPALALSLGWALVVWWFGEAFGMLFMNMANPLTGAPGAVLLYAIIGLLVWPNARPGGLLGPRGARTTWAALWLVMAWLWLLGANSSAGATHDAINAAPSGMSWLSTVQDWVANGAQGNGQVIALVLALVSAVIGIGVAAGWRVRPLIVLAIVLNLAYWVLGQGFGGIFMGSATDPNAGLPFVLLAVAVASAVLPATSTSVSGDVR